MALTSSSTTAQVKAAYEDNADYDLAGSTSKARDFIHAARIYMRRMAEEVERGDDRVKDTYLKIEKRLEEATTWLTARDPTYQTAVAPGSVKHLSVTSDFKS